MFVTSTRTEFEGFHEIVKKTVRFGHGTCLWFPKPAHETETKESSQAEW